MVCFILHLSSFLLILQPDFFYYALMQIYLNLITGVHSVTSKVYMLLKCTFRSMDSTYSWTVSYRLEAQEE